MAFFRRLFRGSHEELLTQGGMYSRLCQVQLDSGI